MSIFTSSARDEQGNELRRRRSDQMPFSIIAKDATIVGDIETNGVVKVEGHVRGVIRADEQILVAQGAVIEGDLHTKEAVVGGEVRGAIHATERVELQQTAVVTGDIFTKRIAILEGGRISGEVKTDSIDGAVAELHIAHNS